MSNNRRPWPTSRKVVVGFLAIVALGAFALLGSMSQGNSMPHIDVPPLVAPANNSASLLFQAESEMDRKAMDSVYDVRSSGTSTAASRAAAVARSARALTTARAALGRPFADPDARKYTGSGSWASVRALARGFAVESWSHADRGEWRSAASSAVDAMELGTNVADAKSDLLGFLVGHACWQVGMARLQVAIPHLSAVDCAFISGRIRNIAANRAPLSAVVEEEKWSTVVRMQQMLSNRDWVRALAEFDAMSTNTGNGPPQPGLISYTRALAVGRGTVMRNVYGTLQVWQRRAATPWPVPQAPRLPRQDVFTKNFVLDYGNIFFRYTQWSTSIALVEGLLALRQYHETRGAWPTSLAQLTPGMLPSAPVDPFRPSKPLVYRLRNGAPLLYSVGPDGVDDGGRPMDRGPQYHASIRHTYTEESRGDAVAGVNR